MSDEHVNEKSEHNERSAPEITMLFDGECPLCSREVRWLERKNTAGRVAFIDISKPEFDAARYGLRYEDVDREIHGVLPDGTIVRRVEVFRRIYRAIGLGWLVAPTGWPVFKPVFDLGYLLFAKNRKRLGRLFGRSCDSNRCG